MSDPSEKKALRRAPLPLVDLELERRIARARGRGNLAEHRLRDDPPALARVHELQTALRRAMNAEPRVREDVLAACDAIESFAAEHGR